MYARDRRGDFYELEMMVSSGPDDFEWVDVDTFQDYEEAYLAMKKLNKSGYSVRLRQCNDSSIHKGHLIEEMEGA